jgi:hypothetical protein
MNLRHPKLLCLLLLLSKAAKPTSKLTVASAPCLSHKTPRTEPKFTAQTTKPLTKQNNSPFERKREKNCKTKFRRVTAAADRATKDPQLQLWRRFAELVNKDCYKSYLRTKSFSGMCLLGEKLATRV